ncbi:MAG TPA: DUF1634 domain-containing protein [Bryobacteraceae bacterium]|jgi:uncharacterized membrane protein|nr:DUF1634 domain-containing protein [Bryobacteraceae bacterium]
MYSDQKMESQMGSLLRAGVVTSCAIILIGGILYVMRHGGERESFAVFQGVPAPLESVRGVLGQARAGSARGIIQLGALALIATPVLRVVFAVYGFARQKQWVFVGISALVLALLAAGLVAG